MRRFCSSLATVLSLVQLPVVALAQEGVVTAGEHYQEVLAAAQATAADAVLIVIGPTEVNEHGKMHSWGYFFQSASLNNILQFVYEEDDKSVRRVTPIRVEGLPLALHPDMTPIPTSWVDSDVALAAADANGGNDYRALSTGDDYHVDMVLLPPEDGGRSALFKEATWLVGYTGKPGELQIPIDAATGTFLEFGVPTARRFLREADSLSEDLGDDLELVLVESNIARPDGSAPIWTYFYRSPSQSIFYGINALEGRMGIIQEPIQENGLLHMDMPALPSHWVDSDTAITEAEQSGGTAFRQIHDEWQISAHVGTFDNELPEWLIEYNSPSGSEQFVVDAVRSNPATARNRLDEVLAMSTQVYSDAKLILVSSPGVDLDGLTNQWSYFFKSVSTPDIFELKVLAGEVMDEVYPFGLNGYLDVFMTPLPYEWVDSDEGIELAEQQGGSEFRQTHEDWKIVPALTFSEPDRLDLEWHFDYQSPSEATTFNVDAAAVNPVTARQLLPEVLAKAEQELGGPQLVWVATTQMDLLGRANEWSYIFTEPGSSNLAEVSVRSGEILPDLTPIPPDETLRLDMPALPEQWVDSDSVIAIVEEIGGEEFRQTNPNVAIDVICAWQERGPTRARNLGERPMCSVLYESEFGGRFRRGVDLEFGAYSTLAKTTAREKLATLADSVAAAGLPEDAQLVNVSSAEVDAAGYTDNWVYLYKSPAQDQWYEFRALGGHVLRLDSVRSVVNLNLDLAPLPEEWIDSPLALKVTELDGGTDFRSEYPEYNIMLDLQVANDGVFWDVLYASDTESQRFRVDALDFSVDTEPIDLPEDHLVLQSYPNPFSGSATIAFTLPQSSDVSVIVYDILGRKRLTVMQRSMPAGRHRLGLEVPALEAGAYFVVVRAGEFIVRGRILKIGG